MSTDHSARMSPRKKQSELEDTPLSDKEVQWWDAPKHHHPMDYMEFEKAFCEYVLLNSSDYSLRAVRDRAFRFIRNFMAPELEKQCNAYQEEHP